MKAKLLRIAALLTVALLTIAAPCPPDPANTVYVVHGWPESGKATVGHARVSSDRVDGLLALQFSRDVEENIVDGPLTLKDFHLLMFVDGFGSIGVSLDAPVTGPSLSSLAEGVTYMHVPLTAHISVTCSTRCEHLGIPFGMSEASVLIDANVHLSEIAAGYIRGYVTSETAWASVDFGLGALDFKITQISFRGSTSTALP